jgi:hypothetical protein
MAQLELAISMDSLASAKPIRAFHYANYENLAFEINDYSALPDLTNISPALLKSRTLPMLRVGMVQRAQSPEQAQGSDQIIVS